MRGFTNRQPSVLSWTVTSPRAKASRALPITSGARVIDSTPPAMTRSASPVAMARAPSISACNPDPQRRLTVAPGTVTGSPAKSALMRATLRLSSPAWLAQPRITSSTVAGSAPARRTTSAITSAPRSSGRTSDSAPRCRPNGVRTASTTNASRKEAAMERILLEGPEGGDAGGRGPVRRPHRGEGGHGHRGGRIVGGRSLSDVTGGDHPADEPHHAAQQRRAGRDGAIALVGVLVEAARVDDTADSGSGDAAGHDGRVDEQDALPGGAVLVLIGQVRAQQPRRQADVEADERAGHQVHDAAFADRAVLPVDSGADTTVRPRGWWIRVVGREPSNREVPFLAVRLPAQRDLGQRTRKRAAERGALNHRHASVGGRAIAQENPTREAQRQAARAPIETS